MWKKTFVIIKSLSLLLFRLRNSLYFKQISKVLRLRCKKIAHESDLIINIRQIDIGHNLGQLQECYAHQLGFFRRIICATCTYIDSYRRVLTYQIHICSSNRSLLTFRDNLISANGKNKHTFYECILLNCVLTSQITIHNITEYYWILLNITEYLYPFVHVEKYIFFRQKKNYLHVKIK